MEIAFPSFGSCMRCVADIHPKSYVKTDAKKLEKKDGDALDRLKPVGSSFSLLIASPPPSFSLSLQTTG